MESPAPFCVEMEHSSAEAGVKSFGDIVESSGVIVESSGVIVESSGVIVESSGEIMEKFGVTAGIVRSDAAA